MTAITRIPALDGVRGLAILMVLTSHFSFGDVYGSRWWWPLQEAGWTGVDLFFVLSGFLITSILLKTRTKANYFREFYRRRALRILPLYYFVLLFSAFCITVVDRQPERLWKGYDGLGWFLAFIPNVAISLKGDYVWQTNWAGLNHLWSLAVEEQFYIFWPLVVWLLPRKPLAWFCGALLLAGVFLREWTDLQFGMQWSKASYMLVYCRMDGLAGGSLLAILAASNILSWKKWEHELVRDFTVLCSMALFYWMVAENSHWRGTLMALSFTGFVYLAMQEKSLVNRICSNAFLRHIGAYSYGLYVFHQLFRLVYEWYIRIPLERTGLPILAVQILYQIIAFGVTYLIARLSYRFVEEPFLNMK